MQAFLCGPRIYEYEGWLFEDHNYLGPWPLRRDGEPRKYASHRFWEMIKRFDKLSPAERKQYQMGGGCTVLTTASIVTTAAADSAAPNLIEAQPQVKPDR